MSFSVSANVLGENPCIVQIKMGGVGTSGAVFHLEIRPQSEAERAVRILNAAEACVRAVEAYNLIERKDSPPSEWEAVVVAMRAAYKALGLET